ncbi:hypothetical protein [Paenibacillus sp. NEAU-GSW1]|uniref:hypothetical protein n=1 Tax=Paenibacillus sp. NEAU-GSW1 TaxID=2682486 RepID=UPI001C12C00A|nr:hypothetical protein [Paenibacillus sp. NEAU-GSW1]
MAIADAVPFSESLFNKEAARIELFNRRTDFIFLSGKAIFQLQLFVKLFERERMVFVGQL